MYAIKHQKFEDFYKDFKEGKIFKEPHSKKSPLSIEFKHNDQIYRIGDGYKELVALRGPEDINKFCIMYDPCAIGWYSMGWYNDMDELLEKGEIKGEKIKDILKNKTVSYEDENSYEEF